MGISIYRSIPAPLANTAPTDIATAGTAGVGQLAAREDHVHRGLSTAVPLDADLTAAALGAQLLAARGDHRHKLADSGWLAPTLLNGWAVYDATFGSANMYRKIGGIVFLRGLIKNGTAGSVIFNLPAGYRPGIRMLFGVDANSSAHGRLDVEVGGNVIHVAGNVGYYQISCSFVADN